MKAIKKSDGEEVEIRLFHPCEYIAIEPDTATAGYAIFRADDLIIDEPVDWSSFRREAAKDCMCQLVGMGRDDGYKYSPYEVAHYAIVYADELIKQLRDGQVHQAKEE